METQNFTPRATTAPDPNQVAILNPLKDPVILIGLVMLQLLAAIFLFFSGSFLFGILLFLSIGLTARGILG